MQRVLGEVWKLISKYLLGRPWLIWHLKSGFRNADTVLSPKPVYRSPSENICCPAARDLCTRHMNSGQNCISPLSVCRQLQNRTTKTSCEVSCSPRADVWVQLMAWAGQHWGSIMWLSQTETSISPSGNKPQPLGNTKSTGRDSTTLARLSLNSPRHSQPNQKDRHLGACKVSWDGGETNLGNGGILLDGWPSTVKIIFQFSGQILFFPNYFCLSLNNPTQKSLSFHHRVEKFLVAFSQTWDPPTHKSQGPHMPWSGDSGAFAG